MWLCDVPGPVLWGVVTPMLLANRAHNKPRGSDPVPYLLVLDVGCSWGDFGGAVLTIIKIVSDRLRPLRTFGHLLEG